MPHRISRLGILWVALSIFLLGAPFLTDTYNTLNQQAFLDLLTRGDPFHFAGPIQLAFRGEVWSLDWPYPPLTIFLDLPAWVILHLTRSEAFYQFFFKLPLFVSAVLTQWFLWRIVVVEELPSHAARLPDFFLLNPGVLLLTSVAGGFDIVAALLILLTYWLYQRNQVGWSGLALGVAGALRLYPLLLAPIYTIDLWKSNARSKRHTMGFAILCLVPIALSCVPFALDDRVGFFSTLGAQQAIVGPFATINVVLPVINSILGFWGHRMDAVSASFLVDGLVLLLVALTLQGLVFTYVWIARHPFSLLRWNLIALLVFFLFYPKLHGLYTIAFLPLALIQPSKLAAWIWLPGTTWMLLVNGAFGARGLGYWLAPLTGIWSSWLTEPMTFTLTTILAGVQLILIIGALAELLANKSETRLEDSQRAIVGG